MFRSHKRRKKIPVQEKGKLYNCLAASIGTCLSLHLYEEAVSRVLEANSVLEAFRSTAVNSINSDLFPTLYTAISLAYCHNQ